jgi:hypothetical protein
LNGFLSGHVTLYYDTQHFIIPVDRLYSFLHHQILPITRIFFDIIFLFLASNFLSPMSVVFGYRFNFPAQRFQMQNTSIINLVIEFPSPVGSYVLTKRRDYTKDFWDK